MRYMIDEKVIGGSQGVRTYGFNMWTVPDRKYAILIVDEETYNAHNTGDTIEIAVTVTAPEDFAKIL